MELNNYICRAKRLDNGEWVQGYYLKHNTVQVCFSSDDPKPKHYIIYEGFCDWGLMPPLLMAEVDPDTVGMCTEFNEFVMADPYVCAPLFEGDIVEVWGQRKVSGEGYNSQYDGDCKIRGVIVFLRGAWRLDLINKYNENLFMARGKEKWDRDLPTTMSLNAFSAPHCKDLNEYRVRNKNYKWGDIVRIGNIFDNPELLEK